MGHCSGFACFGVSGPAVSCIAKVLFLAIPGGTTTIMKRNKIVFALSTVLFALGSLAAWPQSVGAPVEGTVSREGQPLADVQVIFNNTDSGKVIKTKTDKKGGFALIG